MIKHGAILARTLHKWVGLLIGVQMVVWLTTGLYMVIVDIDFIHGDPLVRNMQQTISVPKSDSVSIANIQLKYPGASQITLTAVMGETFFSVTASDQRYLISTDTGEVVSPLNEDSAREVAAFHFKGDAPISRATLVTTDAPTEIQMRRLPLWRIDFQDRYSTSFYIDPYTGKLVTRRHRYWRIFDFLWKLHIMDYDQRTDAHNLLLTTAEVTGLVFVITGLWLLFYSFSGRRRKRDTVK